MDEAVKKNPGGAPKKADKDRRDKRVTVRFTLKEMAYVEQQASRFSLSSAELLRRGALNLKVQEPVSDEQLDVAMSVARMGNNINQCARRLAEINLKLKRLMRVYEESGQVPAFGQKELDELMQMASSANEYTQEIAPKVDELRSILRGTFEG